MRDLERVRAEVEELEYFFEPPAQTLWSMDSWTGFSQKKSTIIMLYHLPVYTCTSYPEFKERYFNWCLVET